LKTRVRKVCNGYHAALYPCPGSFEEREDMLKGVLTRLQDLNMVINQTKDQRQRVLVSVSKDLPKWIIVVKKMKAVYATLNLFNMDVSQKCLIGECWIPTNDLDMVQSALADGSKAVGSTIPSFLNVISTTENPPTFNRTNRFTQGFQNLIDAFGVANYREANPALYTIITFPFLFAIMFGDVGHGFIMFLFGTWMLLSEKKLMAQKKSEIWEIFFGGRYIIFLMGFFSIYTGFIYNDCFSKTMNIFGSSWKIQVENYNWTYKTDMVTQLPQYQLNPSNNELLEDRVYPFGLDPVWMLATNKIIFLNSFKMKVSIIFGVVHMIFGVVMSTVNYNHFRKRASIFLEFLPQVLFLILLFAYMVFMMFWKWVRFTPKSPQPYSPGCAPSVLIYFINMMLFGENKVLDGCKEYMYPFQGQIQLYCVLIALLCIPWMLLGKPLYMICCGQKGGHGHVRNFKYFWMN
jgi:V-type H+-transporting ATPase subunit a